MDRYVYMPYLGWSLGEFGYHLVPRYVEICEKCGHQLQENLEWRPKTAIYKPIQFCPRCQEYHWYIPLS